VLLAADEEVMAALSLEPHGVVVAWVVTLGDLVPLDSGGNPRVRRGVCAGMRGGLIWVAAAVAVGAAGCGGVGERAGASLSAEGMSPVQTESARMVGALTLPAGARAVDAAPVAALGMPATHADESDWVTTTRWWVLPLLPQAVISYLYDHPPKGLRASGETGSGPNEQGLGYVDAGTPPVAASLVTGQGLYVEVEDLSDGMSAVRADGYAQALPQRATVQRVPADIASIEVSFDHGTTVVSRKTVTGPAAAELARRLNALPLLGTSDQFSCPPIRLPNDEPSLVVVAGGVTFTFQLTGCRLGSLNAAGADGLGVVPGGLDDTLASDLGLQIDQLH